MKQFIGILLFTCANAVAFAQVNFVKNPSFEEYTKCPDDNGNINFCRYWSCAVDTDGINRVIAPEHYTSACVPPDMNFNIPTNTRFYQYPHTGNAMVGAVLYYDRTPPPPGGLFDTWRDYFQGRFYRPLEAGKTYCVSFWVNLAEMAGYAQDKIGAYVDNGDINDRDTPGNQILDVTPQVYAATVMDDTMHWEKIEGSFVAVGNETHITLGNFFANTAITAISNTWGFSRQYSYYLFDDVAVVPIDLKADAGKDSHAEPGKSVQIGRVGDTTAMGLDCKWYHKGMLIDSGAVISVKGSTIVGTVDTYVVVQTICGLSKSDTVTVKTVPLGMKEWNTNNTFSVFPNPSNGVLTITSTAVIPQGSVRAVVYDMLGRMVHQQVLDFKNGTATLSVQAAPGVYVVALADGAYNVTHQRIVIE
ncbi:MAG TPA: T9SS type A sorting domain-containing protein [Chitinophagaceae bacterium]|nr:T9SS type A sorting domain-containing protein [Chitinophagaceae bacterium]